MIKLDSSKMPSFSELSPEQQDRVRSSFRSLKAAGLLKPVTDLTGGAERLVEVLSSSFLLKSRGRVHHD